MITGLPSALLQHRMEEPGTQEGLSPDQVERCISSMQSGTQMVKLRGGSKGLVRFYYLDEHKSCIRWRPSRKNEKAKISIDSVQEVCEGKQSEIFQRYADGSFDPNCCFSIYYGDHMESLDLVSSNGEEARTWITGLRYLMAGISDEDSLSKRQRTRDQWLKQTFDEADKNGDGSLSINEVLQLLHKLNVNLPRQKVKQMFKEADTDDNQGTLGFDEFCAFYKMMSTRRDLYLLMLTYSNHKDHLDTEDLKRFLEVEQKMTDVTEQYCLNIIDQFEPCLENKSKEVLGIDGFTNYTRSPEGDIFNPRHYQVNQDMTYPLSYYFITSSHNTYLIGDQLMSQSRVDMYSWVLQAGCRCVEVDCWDGPDGEPIVHHGYTLTSKILFKDVIETINKYAFIKNEYPVILSIENHCSVLQQKKMAQYLTDILGDKLDLSSVSSEDDSTTLPSPEKLKGKILVKGKKLPANISEDAEEGDVSDEDSADEIDEDCKLMNGDASTNRKRVENIAKKKLDSLIKESKIRDCEDPNNFTVSTLPPSGKLGQKAEGKKKFASLGASATDKAMSKVEEDMESGEDLSGSKRNSRLLMSSFSKRKKKGSKLKKTSSLEEGDDDLDSQGSQSRGINRQKKTMKLSRALSDLVKYTKSVGIHDVETEISSSWQVSSFSETKAHQILQQKPAHYLRFNQHQLSRIYPSSYRVDSSNYNPQPFWNAGCQMVALNYQSEGRMLQLNRAKFNANGNCGYVLKPQCMCQGVFNPNSEDPLPGQLKKQLILRIISGQQLPKPRDSMLGDRGEIIDPFVEVEIIGLPVDCNKEQTRVVDDNGFNPMWEETLVFTVHMPEIALVRFLVWDHDPIGRDFIGQRTLAFTSMMPGYRHVYLEGMEEASIFVHVAINDISGKVKQALGLKGLFLRNPKQASLDSHAAGQSHNRPSISGQLLRRTASAPTKSQKKAKKGFPELTMDTKDNGSEGAGEDTSQPRFDSEPESAAPAPGTLGEGPGRGPKGKAQGAGTGRSQSHTAEGPTLSEPTRRSERFQSLGLDSPGERPGTPDGSGPAGMAASCMKCMIGSCEGPEVEGQWSGCQPCPGLAVREAPRPEQCSGGLGGAGRLGLRHWGINEQPRARPDSLTPGPGGGSNNNSNSNGISGQGAARTPPDNAQPLGLGRKSRNLSKCRGAKGPSQSRWPGGKYGSAVNLVTATSGSASSESSSLESLRGPENARRPVGTWQREMNALFVQKLEEIRSQSSLFFTDGRPFSIQRSVSSLYSLETIAEEPLVAKETPFPAPCPLLPPAPISDSEGGSPCSADSGSDTPLSSPSPGGPRTNGPGGLTAPGSHRTEGSPEGERLTNGGEQESRGALPTPPAGQGFLLHPSLSHCEEEPDGAAQRAERTDDPQGPRRPVGSVPLRIPPAAARTLAGPPAVVRRAKSEGQVTFDHLVLRRALSGQSPAAAVYSDATGSDQLWSKLEPGSHRDSMSSSSSMSSNDTVIDLSMPNLVRKSLPNLGCLTGSREKLGGLAVHKGPWPRSAASGGTELPPVTKSKSNPNLRAGVAPPPPPDELQPRPLARRPEDPLASLRRRPTWNRLYMEGLRAEGSSLGPRAQDMGTAAKSKSLGDLTSDDFAPGFESTYRSISRSFGPRPASAAGAGRSLGPRLQAGPRDELTEQLRRLTGFQLAGDITSPTSLGPAEDEEEDEPGPATAGQGPGFLRRSSSRSQSRVRYIATRARQAQERQRLQGLGGRGPLEERGNPEGACSVSREVCVDSLALLIPPSKLTPGLMEDSHSGPVLLKL
ncbi:1-phosphatidylinositol 4,5-bisphosphate phosphodiesterase eta-2 isoform X5 [Dromiciops gliroides]|uniref:1-phosphatidylinositol 4,5-bisphosphate phosphodiesterase eta-2 isoform X5 n=1 Tax=Dromiciops gliroides TaxID=33562 RepID=UPI001CC3D506|nr:1-phosphatidylinositol 4,5-bisphosphate phosphodiesterase eta-2 isoform X5 [Dromiciops gliroides]